MERILCAAIWFDNGKQYEHQPKNIKQGIVSCGRRHHNCFILLNEAFPKRAFEGTTTQGFLTSEDRFVDREEAFKVALSAGQLGFKKMTEIQTRDARLYSEDLY